LMVAAKVRRSAFRRQVGEFLSRRTVFADEPSRLPGEKTR
jgi:hypothetical protein